MKLARWLALIVLAGALVSVASPAGATVAPPNDDSSNATNIAVFSLATKNSWKNDAGTWESRTEWHRCVASGRLAEFGASLAKGAHVAIEGELRSQYLVAYSPSNSAKDGRFRRIEVRLADRPDVRVIHRRGYYAATEEVKR